VKETRTQKGQNRKIQKYTLDATSEKALDSISFENRKPDAKKQSKSHNECQNRKTEVFWHKNRISQTPPPVETTVKIVA